MTLIYCCIHNNYIICCSHAELDVTWKLKLKWEILKKIYIPVFYKANIYTFFLQADSLQTGQYKNETFEEIEISYQEKDKKSDGKNNWQVFPCVREWRLRLEKYETHAIERIQWHVENQNIMLFATCCVCQNMCREIKIEHIFGLRFMFNSLSYFIEWFNFNHWAVAMAISLQSFTALNSKWTIESHNAIAMIETYTVTKNLSYFHRAQFLNFYTNSILKCSIIK